MVAREERNDFLSAQRFSSNDRVSSPASPSTVYYLNNVRLL